MPIQESGTWIIPPWTSSSFGEVPAEIVREVLSYLPVRSLLVTCTVSKDIRRLGSEPVHLLLPQDLPGSSLIPRLSGRHLQVLQLDGCTMFTPEDLKSVLDASPNLRNLSLRGCRQLETLAVPLTLQRLDVTGTSVPLEAIRTIATQAPRMLILFESTTGLWEYLQEEGNTDLWEGVVLRLTIADLEEQLPSATAKALPLLRRKAAGGDVVAALILRGHGEGAALGRWLLCAPLDRQLHSLLMACTMAVPASSIDLLLRIISLGADVNCSTLHRLTALHLASCLGKQEVVRALAGAGARLDYGVGTEQGTALHAAVLAGHDGVVRELLELGANPNIKDAHGNPPASYAAVLNMPTVLRELCERGRADLRLLTQPNALAALSIACGNGAIEVVSLLLAHGIDVNAGRGQKGGTPLHYAVANGRADIVGLLLDAGADVHAVDDHSYQPLYFASVVGHFGIIRDLVRRGASAVACPDAPLSPLQLACAEGRLDTVSLLVSLGGDLNEGSGTALRLATVNNDLRMAAFLLGCGSDPDAADEAGHRPLHMACTRGHADLVHLLLLHGARTDLRSHRHMTPLCCALAAGHFGVARRVYRAMLRQGVAVDGYARFLQPWTGELRVRVGLNGEWRRCAVLAKGQTLAIADDHHDQHQLCRSLGLLPPTSTVASSSAPSPDVRLLAATWDPASSCLNVDLSLARARLVVIDGSGRKGLRLSLEGQTGPCAQCLPPLFLTCMDGLLAEPGWLDALACQFEICGARPIQPLEPAAHPATDSVEGPGGQDHGSSKPVDQQPASNKGAKSNQPREASSSAAGGKKTRSWSSALSALLLRRPSSWAKAEKGQTAVAQESAAEGA